MMPSRRESARTPTIREVWCDPAHLFAFGFGIGLVPVAPGTFGALLGLVFFLGVDAYAGDVMHLALLVVGAFVGVAICGASSRQLQVHDHPGIVWDEIIGCYLACWLGPEGGIWLAFSFASFRLFDIIKPWPIRGLDHGLGGGVGIMLDDVVAAIFAALTVSAAKGLGSIY